MRTRAGLTGKCSTSFTATRPEVLEALRIADKAMALYAAGRPDAALKEIEKAVAAAPDLDCVHFMHGMILSALDRLDEAIAACDRAAMVENPLWHLERATCLSRMGRHEEALAASAEAVRLAPEDGLAWYRRGAALVRAGRAFVYARRGKKWLKEGKVALRRAVALDPAGYLARIDLAAVHMQAGQLAEAEPLVREALDLKFGDPRVHAVAAEWALRSGRLDEAESHAEATVSGNPAAAEGLVLLQRVRRARSSRFYRTVEKGGALLRVPWTVGGLAALGGTAAALAGFTRTQLSLGGLGLVATVLIWAAYDRRRLQRGDGTPILSGGF